MAAVIADIMTDLETQLLTVTGLDVFSFPPAQAVPPFAFVNLPETIVYDASFGRGSDQVTIEVYVCTGAAIDRDSADALTAWASGDASGIKAAIEESTSYDYRVTQATFTQITLAAASYPGVVFSVDVNA